METSSCNFVLSPPPRINLLTKSVARRIGFTEWHAECGIKCLWCSLINDAVEAGWQKKRCFTNLILQRGLAWQVEVFVYRFNRKGNSLPLTLPIYSVLPSWGKESDIVLDGLLRFVILFRTGALTKAPLFDQIYFLKSGGKQREFDLPNEQTSCVQKSQKPHSRQCSPLSHSKMRRRGQKDRGDEVKSQFATE